MLKLFYSYINRWNSWRQASVNRRIFSAALTVGGLTVIVKLMSTVKELIVASKFGTGDSLDAFLLAFSLISFAINVVAGSFNAAFIPTYIQVQQDKGRQGAQHLLSNITFLNIVLLLVICSVLALVGPFIIKAMALSFGPEKLSLTKSLFYVMLPILIIAGTAMLATAVLNAGERFAIAAVIPSGTPIVTVVFLIAMYDTFGIYAFALGTLCGFCIEAILLILSLRRKNINLIPCWHGIDLATKQVIGQYIPMIAGAFIMSGTVLVDQAMAAMLGSGNVSALNYGIKVTALVNGIATMALGTAVFPHFSKMVAEGNWVGIKKTVKTWVFIVLAATIPLTLLLFMYSESVVGILFERGAFTFADTKLVGRVQAMYILQIPFYMVGILVVRLISSLRSNKILMFGTFINLFFNVFLNYVFMKKMGVAGIALSTSVVYFISTLYLITMLYIQIRKEFSKIKSENT